MRSPTQRMRWAITNLRASATLNMRPSAEPVGLIEVSADVALHSLLERREAGIVTRPAQIIDGGLGEILIAVADRFRHRDVFDVWRAPERGEHRRDQITERTCLTGTDVKDAGNRRRRQQPVHHRDGIVDKDEVAPLVAVFDARTVRLEQAHRLATLRLVETLGDETHHLALVVLVRAEHVEKLQAGPLRRQLLALVNPINDGEIKQLLAPAVEIHRSQLAQFRRLPVVGEALTAVAVRGG